MGFSDWIQILTAATSLLLLLTAAGSDIWRYRIPNYLVLGIVGAFAVHALAAANWPQLGWSLLAGLLVMIIGTVLFALRMFGGGDVKLLGAMALWTGFTDLQRFLLIMGVAGGILALAWVLLRLFQRRARAQTVPAPGGETATAPAISKRIPYGVAIAIAGFDFFILNMHSPILRLWPDLS
jgi:prepilin peptidase CpaA